MKRTIIAVIMLFCMVALANSQVRLVASPTSSGGGASNLTKLDFLYGKTFIDADADTWVVFLGGQVDTMRFFLYGAVAQADSDSICVKVTLQTAPYGTGPYMAVSGDSTSAATANTASGSGLYKLNSGTTAYAQSWAQGVTKIEWLRVILTGTATTNTRPVVQFYSVVEPRRTFFVAPPK